jgi:hypothetical protein
LLIEKRGLTLNPSPRETIFCVKAPGLDKFGFSKLGLKGYKTQRIYAYLAERYLSYWFEKYSNYRTWPIIFLDKDTQLKLKN